MMNNKYFGLLLSIIFICLIGSGCTSDEPKKEHTAVTKNTEPKDNLFKNDEDKKVEEEANTLVIEKAPKDSKSPSEAAIHQYKLILANGKENFVTEAEIANEVVLGDKGLVLLDTRKFNDTFILLAYEKSDRWEASAVFEMDYKNSEQFKEADGLSLPFDSFVSANQPKGNPPIWTFSNGEEVVTIAKYKDFEFDKGKNISVETSPGGKQLFVSKEPNQPYLYFEDSRYTILISGTIKMDEMKQLADSMDSDQLSETPI